MQNKKSENIAIITTGGTIGSVVAESVGRMDLHTQRLKSEIEKLCEQENLSVHLHESLNKHSENIAPDDWHDLLSSIDTCISQGFDKIVITHGTDTLLYTATVLGILYSNIDIKICITGSFQTIDHPESDVRINLLAAFATVVSKELAPDVYVAFRENIKNEAATVFPALELKPAYYDAVTFSPYRDRFSAIYSPEGGLKITRIEHIPQYPALTNFARPPAGMFSKAAQRILNINIYPGMSFLYLDTIIGNFDAMIISMFHSGTAPSERLPGSLINFIEANSAKTNILLSMYPEDQIVAPYVSTLDLLNSGGIVIKNIQPHIVYVFLILGMSQGMPVGKVVDLLDAWKFLNTKKLD